MSGTALDRDRTLVEQAVGALRERIRLDSARTAMAVRVVYAGVAAYAVLFAFAAVLHYKVFETPRFDLGNMVQAVWNTQHGHFLENTTLRGQQESRLAGHVDPFLLMFVPLFWVWSNPALLLVVQAFAVAAGALPVFWLARKHLGSSRAGAHFAFAYLLYPATQYNAFTTGSGFHSVAIAVPLVLYAVWLLDEDRLVAFSSVALLAFTTKEEIPLAVGCLGIWYAVRRGRRWFGLSVFGVGVAATLFDFLWVIPHFSPTGADPYAPRYQAVGGTPQGMAHKLIEDPLAFVHAVATGHKAVYVLLLLVPLLGLSLVEPLLLLGAVPDLAINLLSSDSYQTTFKFQYTAGIVPFVVAASIFGAARFGHQALRLSLLALTGTALVAPYSPISNLVGDMRALGSPTVSAESRARALIPPGVAVSTTNRLGSRLSDRRFVYIFPRVGGAHWIIVDVNDPFLGKTVKLEVRSNLQPYLRSPAWRTVLASHGIVVLHRRSDRERVES